MHNFFMYVYFYSLHVSGNCVPIIRRIDCINVTPGICHSDAIPLPLRFNWTLFHASLIRCVTAPLNLHLNPVFHTRNQDADSKELTSHLIKLAWKSGQLNLSCRGIASVAYTRCHIDSVLLMMGT